MSKLETTKTKKTHPFLEKVLTFLHRLIVKLSLKFEGKKAIISIEIDLTKNVHEQIHGIEHTIMASIPSGKDLENYLLTQKA